MADSDKIFNPTPTDDLPQDGKSKGESEQHFETEQAAQALEMVKSGEIRDGKAVILLQYLQTSGLMSGNSDKSD